MDALKNLQKYTTGTTRYFINGSVPHNASNTSAAHPELGKFLRKKGDTVIFKGYKSQAYQLKPQKKFSSLAELYYKKDSIQQKQELPSSLHIKTIEVKSHF